MTMDAHLERLMTRRRFSSRGNSGRETLDVAELASYTMVAVATRS